MADQLRALDDLKKRFTDFQAMSDLIDTMRSTADEINRFNKTAAGNDDFGKQYHQSVDTPTAGMTDLLKQVRQAVDNAGVAGQSTADTLNKADDQNTQIAAGM